MDNRFNNDSFQKVQAFEDFVERVLFPLESYELMHKTNGYEQNSERYVSDSMKPDFRFKSRVIGKEFHIEAKFRSTSYKNQYDTLSQTQVESFPKIHNEEVPVFIALGYGGVASDPEFISLIPFSEHKKVKHLPACKF
jgi:hypothetical protein